MPSAPRRSRIPPVPTLDAANAPPIASPLEPTLLPENRRATCAITSPLPTPPGDALRERRRAQPMENRLGQLRPTQTANCRSKRSSNLPWWAARGTWRGYPQCTKGNAPVAPKLRTTGIIETRISRPCSAGMSEEIWDTNLPDIAEWHLDNDEGSNESGRCPLTHRPLRARPPRPFRLFQQAREGIRPAAEQSCTTDTLI